MNEELNEALEFEIKNRFRPETPGISKHVQPAENSQTVLVILKQINDLLEQLGPMSHLHNQQLQFYRQHKFKMRLPNLLSEIFEIENGPSNHKPANEEIIKYPVKNVNQFADHGPVTVNAPPPSISNFLQSFKTETPPPTTGENQASGQYQIIHLSQNDFNRLSASNFQLKHQGQTVINAQTMQQHQLVLNNQRQQPQQLMIIQGNQS